MNVWEWFKGFFKGVKPGTIDVTTYRADTQTQIALEAYALLTVIDLIASLVSKIEFRTYIDGKEHQGLEWASLNYRPNRNQNAAEFRKELVFRLLYNNEVLIIVTDDGQKLIAETFNKQEYALHETRFTDVTRQGFTFQREFRSSDVYYLRYSTVGCRLFLNNLLGMYEEMIASASDKYQNSNGEKGTLNISAVARGQPDFEERFKKLMNNYFKAYFSNRNGVLPLFDGYTYTRTSTNGNYANHVTDVKTLMSDALSRAAQALQVPAALVTGDVAGIEDAYRVLLTGCIDPLCMMIAREMTGKQYTLREIAKGCVIKADTSAILHTDLIDAAANVDKLIGSGWSHNEVRRALGQHRLDEPWADEHYITKNYQTMQDAQNGGESYAES